MGEGHRKLHHRWLSDRAEKPRAGEGPRQRTLPPRLEKRRCPPTTRFGFAKPCGASNVQNWKVTNLHVLKTLSLQKLVKALQKGNRYRKELLNLSLNLVEQEQQLFEKEFCGLFQQKKKKSLFKGSLYYDCCSSKYLPFKVITIYNCSLEYNLDGLKGYVFSRADMFSG